MSTYEKIASAILAILLAVIIIASYREFKEPAQGPHSDFDQSRGQDFKLGPFTAIVSEQVSGGVEEGCTPLQPVIIGALHDIKTRLNAGATFEVNEPVLQLLCNKNAEITLSDTGGNKLILQKIPFIRGLPPGGTADDIGTRVRINATVVPAGAPVPAQPTTYGEVLIPDRFLDL